MFLLTTTIGMLLAAQDMRTREVSVLVAGVFFLSLVPFVLISVEVIVASIIFFVILSIPLLKQWVAGIDVLFLILTPFMIELDNLPVFFIATGLLLIGYHAFSKDKKAPFLTIYVVILLPMLLWQLRYM